MKYATIQQWAKLNMAGNWGCQKINSENPLEQLKREYMAGWKVDTDEGNYWVWTA